MRLPACRLQVHSSLPGPADSIPHLRPPYFPGRLRVHFGNCQLANWTQPLDSFRWRCQYFECFECWFGICVICVPAGDFASLFVFVSVGQGVRPGMLSFHGTAE